MGLLGAGTGFGGLGGGVLLLGLLHSGGLDLFQDFTDSRSYSHVQIALRPCLFGRGVNHARCVEALLLRSLKLLNHRCGLLPSLLHQPRSKA